MKAARGITVAALAAVAGWGAVWSATAEEADTGSLASSVRISARISGAGPSASAAGSERPSDAPMAAGGVLLVGGSFVLRRRLATVAR
ncbi:MAG TPA: hypothetical protein VNE62_12660 [Actinomycetota bacterium]|nr:hypothetical protein [Actinomycetota bacterium]